MAVSDWLRMKLGSDFCFSCLPRLPVQIGSRETIFMVVAISCDDRIAIVIWCVRSRIRVRLLVLTLIDCPLPRFSCVFSSLPRLQVFLTNPFVSDEIGASNSDHIKICSTIGWLGSQKICIPNYRYCNLTGFQMRCSQWAFGDDRSNEI